MTTASRLLRGAALELTTLREWPGVVLHNGPITVAFPGTEAVTRSSPVHLTLRVTTLDAQIEGGLLVYLGSADGDIDPDGFVGAVAFFTHAGHPPAPYRLPLHAALDRLGRAAPAEPLTATFVPTRDRPLDVTAAIALVRSTVERR